MYGISFTGQFVDRERAHIGMLGKGRALDRSVGFRGRQSEAQQQHNKVSRGLESGYELLVLLPPEPYCQ